MLKLFKKTLISATIAIFISNISYGYTLNDLIKAIKDNKIKEAQFIVNNLDDESLKTLKIIELLRKGNTEEAKRLATNTVLSNVIYLCDNLHAIVVDKVREKLYIVKNKNGFPSIIKTFNCITGKRPGDKFREGDQKTPEGIYLTLKWLSNLPPKYGVGAFVLNYPNLIDKKIVHRNGHGIWIHGIEGDYRPPHSTNGCIALKNNDLKELKKFIEIKKTPIVIVDNLSYETPSKLTKIRTSLINFLFNWKTAWENSPKNIEKYFSFYSEHFVSPKFNNINSWKTYKKKITKGKKWIKIKIANVSISKDGRLLKFGKLYLITFDMNYKSNNYRWKGRKLLYIINEGGKWKILGEESL